MIMICDMILIYNYIYMYMLHDTLDTVPRPRPRLHMLWPRHHIFMASASALLTILRIFRKLYIFQRHLPTE